MNQWKWMKQLAYMITLLLLMVSMLGSASRAFAVSGDPAIAGMDGGDGHALLVYTDGTAAAWGWNREGQLGDGTIYDQYIRKQVAGIGSIKQIAAGGAFSLALKRDGTVWCWGRGCPGLHTDYASDAFKEPVQVEGLSDIVSITAGGGLAAALRRDGTVWTWGNDLMRGQNKDLAIPVQVDGIDGVQSIDAGGYHVVALKRDGTVWTWGYNYYGEIGNGSKELQFKPQQVKGLSDAKAVAGGKYHSAALLDDGTVWAWGLNLGQGTRINYKPVQVRGFDHIVALSAGDGHLVGIRTDGTVRQYGGHPDFMAKAGKITGLSNLVRIAAGNGFSLALRKDGTLFRWGHAQLPDAGSYFSDGKETMPKAVPRPVRFTMDGKPVNLSLSAGYHKGKLMIPRSELWANIGVDVKLTSSKPDTKNYNAVYSTWTFSLGDRNVQYVYGKSGVTVLVNGTPVQNAPELVTFGSSLSSITMVPLRFMCESLGIKVAWDQPSNTFHLSSK
jgi:alpha-tubulin suppressor-like RCC1 family protein